MNQLHKTPTKPTTGRNPESGFTILEAIIATMILIFGLAAIFNLMIIAVSQNSLANRASGATTLASHQMEILRSTAFTGLTDSPSGVDTLDVPTAGFRRIDTVEGVAEYETRWSIQTLTDANLKYVRVRTEPRGFMGRTARTELTTVRSCTLGTAAGCL